jgi:hypothetical protein
VPARFDGGGRLMIFEAAFALGWPFRSARKICGVAHAVFSTVMALKYKGKCDRFRLLKAIP